MVFFVCKEIRHQVSGYRVSLRGEIDDLFIQRHRFTLSSYNRFYALSEG